MTTAPVAIDVGRPGEEPVTEWISLLAFGAAGEALAQHAKGDCISAMGVFTKSTFTDRDGNERASWSLLAESLLSARTTYDRPGNAGPTARPRSAASRTRIGGARRALYSPPSRRAPTMDLPSDPVDDLFIDPGP
jgi:single-stranded DNA-binding protein